MPVEIVTYLFGKKVKRAPFAAGAKPLRVVAEISGGDSIADIAPVTIVPNDAGSIIQIVNLFGIPPKAVFRELAGDEINRANLEADALFGLIHRSLVFTWD